MTHQIDPTNFALVLERVIDGMSLVRRDICQKP